jgi:hypothetical protein
VDTTRSSAWAALVTNDFVATIVPFATWLTGAQKWLRDPRSLSASVPSREPSAMPRRLGESPPSVPANVTCAAHVCIR